MNSEEFERIFEAQVDICRSMLVTKAAEYAEDDDRLHNFDVAAEMQDCLAEQALGGMMAKHTVSIYDMIRGGAESYSIDKWDEKITDHINYLILLRAVVEEAHHPSNSGFSPSFIITDELHKWNADTTEKFRRFFASINKDPHTS